MAHNPIFGSDPTQPASSEMRGENRAAVPAVETAAESDLGELAAKFAAHGGGRVSPELSADLALEIVLNEIAEQACLATGASGAAIVLKRDEQWVCRASAGENAPQLGARLDTATGLSGACVTTRTVQRCDDTLADPRADIEACRGLGVRSVIVFPLVQNGLEQNGELAGVFEMFSSRPSAFGERDERTLEALVQRVLRNLARASDASSPSLKRSETASSIPKSVVVTDAIANSDAAREVEQVSPPGSLQRPVSPTASSRAMNLITWVLGAAVLGYAVLLTVLVGQHVIGGKAAAHGAVNQSAPANRGASASPASAASGEKSESPSPAAPSSATASGAAVSGAVRPTNSSPPPGSLLVYENGKEVFRMLPVPGEGEAAKATRTDGSGMQRASVVEPARILDLTAEAAEGSLLHRVEPDYPETARQQLIQGAVVLDVHIAQDGSVQEVNLVSGPPLLAPAAIDAVKQWRFKPREVSGRPVEMQTRITLNFRLLR